MLKKVSIFILIIALIIMMMPIKSYASIFDPIINYNEYNPGEIESSDKVNGIVNNILGVIYWLGVAISVGALMIIGIKYMTGSLEEKAQYKETLAPYVIGAILLFAVMNILKIIYDVVQKTV